MKLTEEQKHVIQTASQLKKQILTVGGFAGTGKSVCVKHLDQLLDNFATAAFTGKAANVLRKKGMAEASTIHSLIYKPELDAAGHIVLDANGSPNFILNPNLEYNGFIIDEASMVSKDLYKDLCSFNLPIIFVGDHGQLEPVGEGMNLMANPDLTLEKIHRNAGEIAHFAEWIRKGYRAGAFDASAKVKFVSKFNAEKHFTKTDQIICAYNKTRVYVNEKVRSMLELTPNWPVKGDRVMCLRNDKQKNIFNGMQGEIISMAAKPKNKMVFHSDEMDYELLFDPTQFNREKYDFGHDRDNPAPFDYAYCITAHKAQGDEWAKVMVLEQKCKLWDHRRWAYTAASRAKEELIWVEAY